MFYWKKKRKEKEEDQLEVISVSLFNSMYINLHRFFNVKGIIIKEQ